MPAKPARPRSAPPSRRLKATIPVGSAPGRPAVASDGTILVPNNRDNTVSRIDPATNAVIETHRVGAGPIVIRPAFGDLWQKHLRGRTVWRLRVG
jgi:YVTN family beta-propeller protein